MKNLKRVIISIETSRAFGRDLLAGIAQYSKAHGHWSFLRDNRGLKTDIPQIEKWEADGIIMRSTPVLKKIVEFKLPVITVLHHKKKNKILPIIKSDGESIAKLAAEHLRDRGFNNFAFCGYKELNWSIERQNYFYNYLTEMGYSVDVYSPLKNISFQKEQLRIAGWLSSLPKPVGILACNDDRGQHVLEACKLADINVPEDVAVLGVDNDTLICDLCDPPLSSVSLGTIQAGFEASKLLDRLMNGEKMNGQIISVPATHIVKRQSTDILAINDKNIVNALLYIKANFKEKIKVDEVVKATALGRRNLERKFKKVLGRSILEEITRARIEHISKLLIETDLRISEIMSTVNFSEIQHLSRYFRKEKSMSMRDFRNNMKNIKELV